MILLPDTMLIRMFNKILRVILYMSDTYNSPFTGEDL